MWLSVSVCVCVCVFVCEWERSGGWLFFHCTCGCIFEHSVEHKSNVWCVYHTYMMRWNDLHISLFHLYTCIFTCIFLYLNQMKLLHEVVTRNSKKLLAFTLKRACASVHQLENYINFDYKIFRAKFANINCLRLLAKTSCNMANIREKLNITPLVVNPWVL